MNWPLTFVSVLLSTTIYSSFSESEEHFTGYLTDNKIKREDAVDVLDSYLYNYYLTYEQIVARLTTLQDKFPNKITLRVAGHSRENRPIYLVIITDKEIQSTLETDLETMPPISDLLPDNSTMEGVPEPISRRFSNRKLRNEETDVTSRAAEKPVIFVDAGIHAREWVAPAAALYLIDRLRKTPHLTSNLEWRVIPMVNPDGYEYSRTRSRLWRKNRAKTYSSRCRGVDLNRNFPVHFKRTSRNACTETYGGAAAFSEPETRAIRDTLTEVAYRTQAYVTLHTYGQLILHPYGYTKGSKPPTLTKLVQMGNGMSAAIYSKYKNSYRVRQASVLGAAAGGSDDWAYINLGIPYSYTFELQDKVNVRFQFTTRGFVLSPSRLPQAVDECWLGLEYMGNQIIKEQGMKTRVRPVNGSHDISEDHVIPQIPLVEDSDENDDSREYIDDSDEIKLPEEDSQERPISPISESHDVSETQLIPQIHEIGSDEDNGSNEYIQYPVGWEHVIKEVQRVRMEAAEISHRKMKDDCLRRGNMYVCPHMVFWGSMYN